MSFKVTELPAPYHIARDDTALDAAKPFGHTRFPIAARFGRGRRSKKPRALGGNCLRKCRRATP